MNCFEALKNLWLADNLRKYPDLPYRYPPKYTDRTTNGLTRCVLDFLRLSGHHCERTGNEGRIIDNRQLVSDHMGHQRMIGTVQRVRGSGMRGTSDLKAIIHGHFTAIEIKNAATGDRQRPEQKTYQQRVEAAGGVYMIATSFGQFLTWYYSFTGEVGAIELH